MIKTMKLGGIEIPALAALDFSVGDSKDIRETIHKMGDGSCYKQVYAGSQKKGRLVLRGSGVVPPGLDMLETTGTLELLLASERSQNSTLTDIAIPAARRTDSGYEPWGRAFIDNRIVPTAVSVVANVASLTPVADADYYQVLWYPKLTVYTVGDIQTTTDVTGAITSWQLELVEK